MGKEDQFSSFLMSEFHYINVAEERGAIQEHLLIKFGETLHDISNKLINLDAPYLSESINWKLAESVC